MICNLHIGRQLSLLRISRGRSPPAGGCLAVLRGRLEGSGDSILSADAAVLIKVLPEVLLETPDDVAQELLGVQQPFLEPRDPLLELFSPVLELVSSIFEIVRPVRVLRDLTLLKQIPEEAHSSCWDKVCCLLDGAVQRRNASRQE